jgi:hypothetical protein
MYLSMGICDVGNIMSLIYISWVFKKPPLYFTKNLMRLTYSLNTSPYLLTISFVAIVDYTYSTNLTTGKTLRYSFRSSSLLISYLRGRQTSDSEFLPLKNLLYHIQGI